LEFKRLKKWENELNICIRCGYCYELCHLYKLFSWETDTPRGKLLLAYGLLTGEIEPSPYIAEKIFQCFYCKNCSKSCSAKVPVTDILTDARADLFEAGFEAEGTTVKVNEDLCSGCGVCVSVCKSEAISIKEENGIRKAVVNKVQCKGCGVCIAACPSGAISLREGFGVSKLELLTHVKNFLKAG
jgi:ferredoxin